MVDTTLEHAMPTKGRRSAVDSAIAVKAAKMFVPSMEEQYMSRALGDDQVREVRQWGRSQTGTKMTLVEAIRRLVEIGLGAKPKG
jgi:hypothetical protein